MSRDSTTAGNSYSYNIPKEYKSTTTSSFPCYKDLSGYGPCLGATIIPPLPMTVKPPIFYHATPHKYENKMPEDGLLLYQSNGSLYQKPQNYKGNGNFFGHGTNPNDVQYKKIYQSGYIWGGLGNKPYPPGSEKLSSFY
jgi:hypothetical protein